ncbi:MAG: hypothetical protein U0X20_32835, partial [Caldilineaceae bacterium]
EVLQIADLASKSQSDYGKRIMDAFFGINATKGTQTSGTAIGALAAAPLKPCAPKPVPPPLPAAVCCCPKCNDPVGAQDQYCLNCVAKVV